VEEGGKAVLTFEQMKELIELVAGHRLGGVEVERSGFRFKVDGFRAAGAPAAAGAGAAATDGALAGALPSLQAPGAPGLAAAAGADGALGSLPPAAAVPPQGLPVHAGELVASALPGAAGAASPASAALPSRAAADQQAHILNSPIVGTFYRAPAPEAPPFVEVGSRVRTGQVLCIIEAMKLMNEIESDIDGTIAQIYPQNAQAVEFGEPLFAIRPA
jgi:acetyl-CoA carboxylase biotin carboxyl carrier protein